jgi:hypothetical protein
VQRMRCLLEGKEKMKTEKERRLGKKMCSIRPAPRSVQRAASRAATMAAD